MRSKCPSHVRTSHHKMADDELLVPEVGNENPDDVVFNIDAKMKNVNIDGDTIGIPKWLHHTECPFNWLQVPFPDVSSKEIINKVKERIEMDGGLNDSFPFEKFVCMLTLVFELSSQGEKISACENFELCEELLEKEGSEDDKVYSKIREAVIHVLQATKAHLLFHTGDELKAKQVVEGLQLLSDMSVEGLAALQGLKACFFHHYRGDGARLALQHARMALTLAPDTSLWLILTAQSIRRLRKLQPSLEEVSTEEVELLKRAVDKKRSARHLLLLAQAYREAGECRFQKHRNDQDFFHSQIFHEISDMQEKAFALYKEAILLRPDCEVVNRLCGYGLLKLPAFKSDYRLAERCLQKALEQDPTNATTIHALGLHYYKSLMDYEKAALFCEKAGKLGNFPASLDMLRMKRLVYGNSYDPAFDFQKLLHQYGDDQTKRHEILCQMGSYYFLFERNLGKALKYFKTLVKENAELSIMTSHKCTFLNMAYKINIFQFIVNEGLQTLQENKGHRLEAEENLDTEEKLESEESSLKDVHIFLEDLKLTNPELFEVPINVNLIDDLHKVSDDIKQTYLRKKERRNSAKERWRGFLVERRKSLDNNATQSNLRQQSESGLNFRRRSSGNVDLFQNRSYKNVNSADSKQRSFEGTNKQNKGDSHKEDIFYFNSNSNIFRRRSSDSGQNRTLRSLHCPQQRKEFFDGSQISESIRESSCEAEKPLQGLKSGQSQNSNGYKNGNRRGNAKLCYKRYQSCSGSTTAEESQTNWRIKN